MFEITNKIVVVTGASSGLGADAARVYAQAGASVAILARRKKKLDSLAKELTDMDNDVLAVACDVTDEESVKNAVNTVLDKYGRIDILLNNAGDATLGGVHNLSVEDWDKTMNVNVKGIFLMSKYIVPQMIKNNYGKIVNIASINAVIADKLDIFTRHAYNTSKSAVIGLTKAMAASYGKNNITVNAIGPGLFETEMTSSTMFASKEFMIAFNETNPMCRPGKKGELNGTILYLSSDASSYITGQFIIAGGGAEIV